MKKLLLLSILLSGKAYSQEYTFNIPMVDKPHEVIKFSSESGKTYNWDRCSGQTTQVLSEDGVACEKVINNRSGFTGSVDVCVSATKESLSDPYCFAMCQGKSVTWGNCTASVTLSEHLEIKNITNTDNSYVGTAEMLCTDGNWSIRSSTCEDNLPVCGSDHNTINNNPTNLCEVGSASSVISNANTMNWNCTTSVNSTACLSYKVAVCDNNTFNGCIIGTSGGYTSSINDTTATWTCSNESSSANCSKVKINGTNGVCGSSNGQTLLNSPTTNLCTAGVASAVTKIGFEYKWSCSGQNGTHEMKSSETVNCIANTYNDLGYDKDGFDKNGLGVEECSFSGTNYIEYYYNPYPYGVDEFHNYIINGVKSNNLRNINVNTHTYNMLGYQYYKKPSSNFNIIEEAYYEYNSGSGIVDSYWSISRASICRKKIK